MKASYRMARIAWPVVLLFLALQTANGLDTTINGRQIPDPLKPWMDWAIWDETDRLCPTPYDDSTKHFCVWPSVLDLRADHMSGQFNLTVTVFHDSWLALPGSQETWPFGVKAGNTDVPVLEHNSAPSVYLTTGTYHLTGSYQWDEIPQKITLPQEIGLLALTVEGKTIDNATWDSDGSLWLKRDRAEATDKDFLGVKIYRMIEDGIPMWLHTEVELSVAGKSREEDLHSILPEGWQLAMVDSPLPVAIDEAGHMKAQVRVGKWMMHLDAFHLTPAVTFGFATDASPLAQEELVAFKAAPDFRMVEVDGVPAIDVSQTTFPQEWRDLPVYHWETNSPFHLVERMRGMGLQKPEGLTIQRQLWMDENGQGLVFRDHITGQAQQIWRLDIADNEDLGSVRSAGQGQLITRNPVSGASGVEIRGRNLDLEGAGRLNRAASFSATGWKTDADSVSVTLNLPPGWRLLALFGSDWVDGDWLTAWTLLDLFLLLIFSLAVYRLYGIGLGALAFFAFGLAYHEPGAPRYLWLLLLIPLALLRVAPSGQIRVWLLRLKYLLVAALILDLVPFLAGQVQQVLYPQLEDTSTAYYSLLGGMAAKQVLISSMASRSETTLPPAGIPQQIEINGNLAYDTKVRIQTGPGIPEWSWRTITFGWNGPVASSQKIYPVLISPWQHRLLTVLRVALLLFLAWFLFDGSRIRPLFGNAAARTVTALIVFLGFTSATPARAQIPDKDTLTLLHDRLMQTSDAYPNAADIPEVSLSLQDRHVVMEAEIDTALFVAVPLPGRLPAWSPVSVVADGRQDVALRREDGYLWVTLPAGVHHVHLEGSLADVTEWEWTFRLKPRHVTINAPGWSFTGLRPNGIPEQQVFFTQKQKSAGTEASYDRQELHTVAGLDRHLELGLVWQVHNEVSRLSPVDRAISIRVPLLPGEKVLSSSITPQDGFIDVRLGANEKSFTWDSELPMTDHLALATKPDDIWVERWYLVVSPVWNIAMSGLPPVFETSSANLVPVWHPWPGEKADLTISRPEAISGATVTVHNVQQTVTLGSRQRASELDLQLQCSLGEDFAIELPSQVDITSLTLNDTAIPVRKDGPRVIVPLQPGDQKIVLQWKTGGSLGLYASADQVHLPVESANITTILSVPENRWVLWTNGPLRGPAVQFWVFVICWIIGAPILARLKLSPLTAWQWFLLGIGLTQVDLPGLIVVGWFFALAWRGAASFQNLKPWLYNLTQVFLLGWTGISLLFVLKVLGAGFLGRPEMFIAGNDSSSWSLQWYQPRGDLTLPQPGCFLVSIWWYRLLMLAWALWFASSVIRWLTWAWAQFSHGGIYHKTPKKIVTPPPFSAG